MNVIYFFTQCKKLKKLKHVLREVFSASLKNNGFLLKPKIID